MPAPRPVERLRFSTRSVVLAVALLGGVLALLRLVEAASRVLGWVVAATVIAGLLWPFVWLLSRWLPRGLAVAVVVVSVLGFIGTVVYGVVEEVTSELDELERAAPNAARDLERSDRFGEFARDFELVERTEEFVDQVPELLRGGTPGEALQSAATRGVAFLATGVLSLFFVVHGQRLLSAAVRQLPEPAHRRRVAEVAGAAYRRAWAYISSSVVLAIVAGLLAYTLARITEVPGAAPLGVWAGLWDLVPVIGVVIGTLPVALLLAATQSAERAVFVLVVIVGYQIFEALWFHRRLDARSLRLGPFLTVAAAMVGLEVYGLGGALVALVAVTLTVAVADELAPGTAGSETTDG